MPLPGEQGGAPVIGVGSSAGGLEALRALFSASCGDRAAWVVAQHLSPHHDSRLVDLLARATGLAVRPVREGEIPEAGTVYAVPPGFDAILEEGALHLREPEKPGRPVPSVDRLFASLARERGEGAVGVILSGSGSDGSAGVRTIKAAGGITLAQDPAEAGHDGMPAAAGRTGCVDHIAPAAELAAILDRLHGSRPAPAPAEQELEAVVGAVQAHTGVDLRAYRETMLRRRIARRLAATDDPSLVAYADRLQADAAEARALVREVLISVTAFFRNPGAWEALRPHLAAALERADPAAGFRVWVPGCATGEEAWSVLLLILDILGPEAAHRRIRILATDLDEGALEVGREGIYEASALQNLPEGQLQRWFEPLGDGRYRLLRSLRERVVFSRHDLLEEPPFLHLDLITCRNLLIYLQTPVQERLLELFHYGLNPDGLLLLGHSEAITRRDHLFTPVDRRWRLFRRQGEADYRPPVGRFRGAPSTGASPASADAERAVQTVALTAYTPPGVVVDREGVVRHVHGNLTPWLGPADSLVGARLVDRIREALADELQEVVEAARYRERVARGRPVTPAGGAGVRLAAHPVRGEQVFVVFEPLPTQAGEEGERILELEGELATTRQDLERSNQELQAANEELQASNEELETTNEELQSSNEELDSVNAELGARTTELAAALDDLENVKDSLTDPLVVVDAEQRLTLANTAAHRLLEVDGEPGELPLAALAARLGPADLTERVERVRVRDEPEEVDAGRGAAPSPERAFRLRLQPYRRRDGTVLGTILLFFDRTEVDRAERRARASEDRLRSILRHAPFFLYVREASGRFLLANPALERQLGLAEDSLAEGAGDPLPEALRADWDAADGAILASEPGDGVRERDEGWEDGEGGRREVLTERFPLLDEEGAAYAVCMIGMDITERRAAEEREHRQARALAESDRRVRQAQEHAGVAFFAWDPADDRVEAGDPLATLLGVSPAALEGFTGADWAERVHPEDRGTVEAAMSEAVECGTEIALDYRVLDPDGEIRWVREQGSAEFGEDGRAIVYGIALDVTAAHEVNRALEDARVAAETANRAKSEFLSRMSHELRTPLNAILGFAQLLEADPSAPLSQPQQESVDQIQRAGWHLLELVNEILDLARIEAGRMEMAPEPLEVATVVEEAASMVRPQAEAAGVTVVPPAPGVRVHADPRRLRQVLVNLLANAVKYNRPGGRVEVSALPGRDEVALAVADTGVGMDEAARERLFEPFERLDQEGETIEGSGIGLAVTQRLVLLMGGRIEVASTPGEGTTFTLHLPSAGRRPPLPAGSEADEPGERILYVDDEAANVQLVRSWLERHGGLTLYAASSAAEALALVPDHPPDLLLLDRRLPDADGSHLLAELRALPGMEAVPAIALTAEPEAGPALVAAGFDGWLGKPFHLGELLTTARRTLHRE